MDFSKVLDLGKRIYNNKMIEKKDENGKTILSDKDAIKALCSKAFYDTGEIKNLEDFRSFNRLIVQVAELEAEAQIEPLIMLFSNYDSIGVNDTKVYEIPKKARITMALTASGSGVDFQRIPIGKAKFPARPEKHQFGAKYNVNDMISDPVNGFKDAVDLVVEYKFKYIFNKIMKLARTGKDAGKIPSGQVIDAANIQFVDYRKLENRLLRYGNGVTPIMIADRNLIDAFAMKEMTTNLGVDGKEGILGTDDLKTEILREANITKVSRTVAVATDNPFLDHTHTNTALPVNEGIVVAGGNKSPFYVTEFGPMRMAQDLPDIENEEVHMKIDMKIDISLLLGYAMGYIRDTAVVI